MKVGVKIEVRLGGIHRGHVCTVINNVFKRAIIVTGNGNNFAFVTY